MLAAAGVINEVMAVNATGLLDLDLDTSDWIEIHNPDPTPLDLTGWHLTDDDEQLDQWTFPAGATVPENGYLVVFASVKDLTSDLNELHTNFRINSGGEFLALVTPQLEIAHQYNPLPPQRADVSYGLTDAGPLYFAKPTPGAANGEGVVGFVADTTFDHDRGLYDSSDTFVLTITSETVGATIYYTTDFTEPTPDNSSAKVFDPQDPIPIFTTTAVRAAAYKDDLLPTNVDTQTYIFPDDVLTQPTNPQGFPLTWGGAGASDYEMDPEIATNTNSRDYDPRVREALLTHPTISIVTDMDNLFDPATGIYSNPLSRGDAWEKPISIEFFDAFGGRQIQADAGLKIQGSFSRNTSIPKHNMRVIFRSEYGPSRLEYPVFPDTQVEVFNGLLLRGGNGDSWFHTVTNQRRRAQYIRDQWHRDAQAAMGRLTSLQTYHHLYLNGVYWGLYHTFERDDAEFMAAHLGGTALDYDAVKDLNQQSGLVEAIDGDLVAWDAMIAIAAAGVSSQAKYEEIQEYLDVDNLIDYILVNFYSGNFDWDRKNWRAARKREPGAGYQFFAWDSERTIGGNNETNLDLTKNITGTNNANRPSGLHQDLTTNAEYRLRFADAVHKHFFNDGVLTPAGVRSLWDARVDELSTALVAEAARWGDSKRANNPYTPDDEWMTEVNLLRNSYFPARTNIVLNQLRSRGLYPSVVAPAFNQHGGAVEAEFNLSISAPAGTIYYTLDGSDPRLMDGAISPTALRFEGDPIVLSTNTTVKSRVRSGNTWSALNQAEFFVDPATAENLAITEINYNPQPPTPAELAEDETWLEDDFEFVELMNTSDRSIVMVGVRFTAGMQFEFTTGAGSLAPGERVVVVNNLPAFRARYGDAPAVAGQFSSGRLSNSGENIEVTGADGTIIRRFKYNDGGNWPGRADGRGATLELIDTAGDYEDSSNWRSSIEFGGTPGTAGVGIASGIVVNEVLTHTDLPQLDAIELFNPTDRPIDLGGWFISDTGNNYRKFRIPDGTVIADGGYVVFDERDFNPSGGIDPEMHPNDFGLDSADGDDVWLLEGDSQGRLIRFVDHVEFDAAANGVSFGRYEKSTGKIDFTALDTLTLGEQNSGPRIGPIVIHELLYNPDAEGTEFIELKNISGEDVPLFDPLHPENTWRIGGVDYDLPGGLTLVAGRIALVVPVDPEQYRIEHAVPDDVLVLGPYSGRLDNDGERITLWRPDTPQPAVEGEAPLVPMIAVDSVRYNDALPWPLEADGQGASLQRVNATAYANDPVSWIANFRGGTPGDEPPRVSEVLLFGSSWAPSTGYSISAGAPQLTPAPLSGIDQIRIRFTHDVQVASDDLTVTGVNRGRYEPVGFSYDPQEFLASWSFDAMLRADKLQLELNDAVRDTGGRSLDGNWTDAISAFPSGDGLISEHDPFRFRLNVLPGDVDGSEAVDRGDLLSIIGGLGGSANQGRYNARLDVNVDGQVNVDDLREVLARLGSRLPSGNPANAAGPPVSVAVDAVFTRVGAGPSPAATVMSGGADNLSSGTRGAKRIRGRVNRSVSSALHHSPLRRLQATAVDVAVDSPGPLDRERIIATRRRR
jgi:hypothetical protein